MGAVKVELGQRRGDDDGSRRFTPTAFSFDTRAVTLSAAIEDDWEESIKAQWSSSQQSIREVLIHTFGAHNHEAKIQNFVDLGAAPWSVVALTRPALNQSTALTWNCGFAAAGSCLDCVFKLSPWRRARKRWDRTNIFTT